MVRIHHEGGLDGWHTPGTTMRRAHAGRQGGVTNSSLRSATTPSPRPFLNADHQIPTPPPYIAQWEYYALPGPPAGRRDGVHGHRANCRGSPFKKT